VPALTYRDIQKGLRQLGLDSHSQVLAHVNLEALGEVRGGAATVAGALAAQCGLVLAPAFTPPCQVWPLVGPEQNGCDYAGHALENAEAEIFSLDQPVTGLPGGQAAVAEALRHATGARRSAHPLYSFTAVGPSAQVVLSAQTLADPLGPIAHLAEVVPDASVLLVGTGQAANVAIHYAEARAGRKQFIRWALTGQGAVECVACPGCSDGFEALAPALRGITCVAQIGAARAECVPLAGLVRAASELLLRDPFALLCQRATCLRCVAVRASILPT
jgi:aminoglycoside 3-N-acetyltransferase